MISVIRWGNFPSVGFVFEPSVVKYDFWLTCMSKEDYYGLV